MNVYVEIIAGFAVVRPEIDALDVTNASQFKRDIEALLPTHHRVVLDLSTITFMDSAGVGALLFCKRRVGHFNGSLGVCNLHENVSRILTQTRMTKILNIYPDSAGAIAAQNNCSERYTLAPNSNSTPPY